MSYQAGANALATPPATQSGLDRSVGQHSSGSVFTGQHVRLGLLLTVVATLGFTAVAAITRGPTEVLLCLTGLATLSILLLTTYYRKDYDAFEPLTFVILAAAIGTGLKAPYLALVDTEHARQFIMLGQPLELLLPASGLILVGLVAFCAGYLIRTPSMALSGTQIIRRLHWDRNLLSYVSAVALVVSVTAFGVWYRRMGIEIGALVDISGKRYYMVEGADYAYSTLGYLSWGVSLAAYAFYVLLAWRLAATRAMPLLARVALPLTGLIALAFPIIRSSRASAVAVILTALILVHYLHGGIKLRRAATVVGIGLVIFIAVTGLRSARELSDVTAWYDARAVMDVTVGGRHFMDVAKTAHIMAAFPDQIDYKYGSTLINWVTAPIPRTVWKEKPPLGIGPIIGTEIFGSRRAGVPPGFIAELYLNFGALAVPLGMFIAGILLRALYINFVRHRNNINAVLLYAILVIPFSFSLMQGELSRVMSDTLRASIPLIILILLVGRKQSSPRTI